MNTNSLSGYVLLSMPTDQVQPLHLLTMANKRVANTTSVRIDDLFVDSEIALPKPQDHLLTGDISKTYVVY